MITCYSPTILFLTETKKKDNGIIFKRLLNIGTLTNFHSIGCSINGMGKIGGLALLWSKDVNLYIIDSNKNMIDFYIENSNETNSNSNTTWRGINIYGYPKSNQIF